MTNNQEDLLALFLFAFVLGTTALISISLNQKKYKNKKQEERFNRKRQFKVIDGGKK